MLVERVGSKKYVSQMLDDYMICFIIFQLRFKSCKFFYPLKTITVTTGIIKTAFRINE